MAALSSVRHNEKCLHDLGLNNTTTSVRLFPHKKIGALPPNIIGANSALHFKPEPCN